MSKKRTNTVPAIPELYHGVNRRPETQKFCLVEDIHGQYFMYPTTAEINVVKGAQQKIWPNFDAFSDMPKQELLTYHESLFKAEPPTGQDLVTTAIYCWFALIAKATDRTVKTPKTSEGRRATILNCQYHPGEETGTGDLKTPQALACARIFQDSLKDPRAITTDAGVYIKEEHLKAIVEERANELHTRQEPWRIFQYYRPKLISAKILRRA